MSMKMVQHMKIMQEIIRITILNLFMKIDLGDLASNGYVK